MLKILTLNCNYYFDKTGPWPRRKGLIGALLREHSADFVALQAVKKDPRLYGGLDQSVQLAAEGRYPHHVFQPAQRTDDGVEEGLAILSRHEIRKTDYLPLTLNNIEDKSPRILLRAECRLPSGTVFALFNAYFSWVTEQTAFNLQEAMPYLNAFKGPAVCAGDFNTPDTSAALSPFTAANWADAWRKRQNGHPGLTYPSADPEIRIDYIWASGDLQEHIESVRVIADEADNDNVRPSDHFGLLAAFSI